MSGSFSPAQKHSPREGLTISTDAGMKSDTRVTWFSMGADTDISEETYNRPAIYIGMGGKGCFKIANKGREVQMKEGEMSYVPRDTLCGVETDEGFVYAEIMPKEDLKLNQMIKPGEVFRLAELLPYEEGSIVNRDVASNDAMKFVLMAFDKGTGLTPHRAPGDALVFALEGRAVIGYEGEEFSIEAGQTFRFEKNGLHSVTAEGRFKMALLLTLR